MALCRQLTALLQVPHGHFGVLGPGFVSVSDAFANSNINMYLHTGLLLFTFSCVVSIAVTGVPVCMAFVLLFVSVFELWLFNEFGCFICMTTIRIIDVTKIVYFISIFHLQSSNLFRI